MANNRKKKYNPNKLAMIPPPKDLSVSVGILNGNVVVEFNAPMRWMGMPPSQALDFAAQVTKLANQILTQPKKEEPHDAGQPDETRAENS